MSSDRQEEQEKLVESILRSMEMAPPELDFAAIQGWLHLCGTLVPADDRSFQEEVTKWYQEFRRFPAPRLPLVVPYFLDLALLVVHDHPPFRQPSAADNRMWEYLDTYRDQHLIPLAMQPAVRFVRRQLGSVDENPDVVARVVPKVVARFVWQVMVGLTRIYEKSGDPYRRLLEEDGPRWLPDPAGMEQFLECNTELVAPHEHMRGLIPPLERFLLGATRVESSFENANGELIAKCLTSDDLTQHHRRPHPVVRSAGHCTDVGDEPGELVNIRKVCKTTELRKIAQVVPQDYALLGWKEDGVRYFMHKMRKPKFGGPIRTALRNQRSTDV